MDATASPFATVLGRHLAAVQQVSDLRFKHAFLYEGLVHPADCFDFHRRTGNQDDPVGLDALVLAPGKLAFVDTVLVDEHTPQAIAGRAALTKADLNQSTLTCEDLC